MFRFNTQLNIPKDSSDKNFRIGESGSPGANAKERESVPLLSYFIRNHREKEK